MLKDCPHNFWGFVTIHTTADKTTDSDAAAAASASAGDGGAGGGGPARPDASLSAKRRGFTRSARFVNGELFPLAVSLGLDCDEPILLQSSSNFLKPQ